LVRGHRAGLTRHNGAVEWSRRRKAAIAGAVALLLVAALAWLILRDDPRPAPPAAAPPPTLTPSPPPPAPPRDICDDQARRRFVPEAISVEHVVRRARVTGYPRDAAGVPGVPPVTAKDVFAWDLGGVEPGSKQGHVLLNAHTWPNGSAMGNRLLAGLQVGGRIVLRGAGGKVACYRVTQRTEVRAEEGYPGWSASDGPSAVVIVVCSGVRRGPRDWSHRTLWFAEPA
jgi:hypothetical protein